MSKSVSAMTPEEQQTLIDQFTECIHKHGFENDIQVVKYRETVCALAANEVDDKMLIKIEKEFPPEMKERAEAFTTDAKAIAGSIDGVSIKVSSVIKAGCQYEPISGIVPVRGGDPITLEHVPGEVWLIDFWATWCPPCQAPMQHNEDMLTKRGAEWGDKVKIIGISIDNTADAVVKHIDSKDWNRPIHYHRAKSNCSDVYQVRGVPHVMLLDTNGKIVFKGHPAGRPNLEDDFDKLLKGETIKVDGEEEDEAEEEGATNALNGAACMEYLTKFKNEVGTGLQKNEGIAAIAKTMPRAFCVLVYNEKLNVATKATKITFENYRVLVGPGEAVDKCKEIIDAAMDKDVGFKVILREHKTS